MCSDVEKQDVSLQCSESHTGHEAFWEALGIKAHFRRQSTHLCNCHQVKPTQTGKNQSKALLCFVPSHHEEETLPKAQGTLYQAMLST